MNLGSLIGELRLRAAEGSRLARPTSREPRGLGKTILDALRQSPGRTWRELFELCSPGHRRSFNTTLCRMTRSGELRRTGSRNTFRYWIAE